MHSFSTPSINSPTDPSRSTPDSSTQQSHLRSTLEQISQLANDVEMEPPPSELLVYIVVDTNILLHHFEVLKTLVDDAEKIDLPVIVVLPGAVIYELDRQKNRDGLGWPARRASGWLLEKVKLQKSVKAQATNETCKITKNWRTRDPQQISIPDGMINDHNILDCCQFFQLRYNTILCSADNNLCIIAQSQGLESYIDLESDKARVVFYYIGIHTMSPSRTTSWTSRDVVRLLYGPQFVYLNLFSSSNAAYSSTDRKASKAVEEVDRMIIDDDDSGQVKETPVNVLHDDVREYFTRLLQGLVGKVGGPEIRGCGGRLLSRHASEWQKKPYKDWTAADCLEYLYDKSHGLKQQMRHPEPERFLSKRYTVSGARTGHEWSAEAWRVGLSNLKVIGAEFGDLRFEESVNEVILYLSAVLN